jgi:hypothetical protein
MGVWTGNGGLTSFAVSDGTNGAWTLDVDGIPSGNAGGQLSSFPNNAGGFTQVTIAVQGGGATAGWYTDLWEVSGTDNGLAALTGTRAEGADSTSHQCADTGVSGTGFIACMGTFFTGGASADGGAKTGITSWTNDSFDTFVMTQRHIGTFSTAVGAFTTANSVDYYGALALYREAGAGGGSSTCRGALSLLGVGGC